MLDPSLIGIYSIEMSMSKLELLENMLSKALGDDYDEKEVQKEIYSVYRADPKNYTPAHLRKYLLQYIRKDAIDNILTDIEKKGFWVQQPVLEGKLSFVNEQGILADLESDYQKIPTQTESAERLLYRCLILAFIKANGGAIVPKLEEFRNARPQFLLQEVKMLQDAIRREGRLTVELTKHFSTIANIDLSKEQEEGTSSVYNSLSAIKEELIPIDVFLLKRLIDNAVAAKNDIAGKNIFLFIGDTGSGKTTTIKALLGYKMVKGLYKGMRTIAIDQRTEKVTEKKILNMESNPSCKSVTRYLVAVKPKSSVTQKDVWLVDTPGWGDTRGLQVQLANFTGVKEALNGCNQVVPVIVISKDSCGRRLEGIKKLGQTISAIFDDYSRVSNSVAIMINRFSEEERKQLGFMFKDLLDEASASDRADRNMVAFLEHLTQLAQEDRLINFDPISSDPKECMSLLTKMNFGRPGEVFKYENPSQSIMKIFCDENEKRIFYYLKQRSMEMVKYFLQNMHNLNDLIGEKTITEKLRSIKQRIKEELERLFNEIAHPFNSKLRAALVQQNDIEKYISDIHDLSIFTSLKEALAEDRRSFGVSDRNFDMKYDLKERGLMNMREQIETLVQPFTCEQIREEENEGNFKQARKDEILKIFSLFRKAVPEVVEPIAVKMKQQVEKRIASSTKAYMESVNQGAYAKAALEFQTATRTIRYRSLMVEVTLDKDRGNIERFLSQFVQGKTKEGRNASQNHTKLVQIDNQLAEITSCNELMGCQTKESISQINSDVEYFVQYLKKLSDNEANDCQDILQKASSNSLHPRDVENYRTHFIKTTEFGSIKSIEESIKDKIESINRTLEHFLRTQESTLTQIINNIKRNPDELENKIEGVDTALVGIQLLAEFAEPKLRESAIKIKEEVTKLFADYMPKFLDHLNNIPKDFRYSSNKDGGATLQRIYRGKLLEDVFRKLKAFTKEREQLETRNKTHELLIRGALNRAEQYLKDQMDVGEGSSLRKYEAFNFVQVEMEFKFIGIISESDCPFSSLQEEASRIYIAVRTMVVGLRGYFNEVLGGFTKAILMVQDETNKRQQDNALQALGEACRQIWKRVRRISLHVKNIMDKSEVLLQELNEFQLTQMWNLFLADIQSLFERYNKDWEQIKKIGNNSARLIRLQLLLKKCEMFNKSQDSEIIEQHAEEFSVLRQKIEQSIGESESKAVGNIEKLLSNKRFCELKTYIDNLKAHKQEKLYSQTEMKIQDYTHQFIKEKNSTINKLFRQGLGGFDIDQISRCAEEQKEIAGLMSCNPNNENLRKLQKTLDSQITSLKPKVLNCLNSCIAEDKMDEALKALSMLEAIEKNIASEANSKQSLQYSQIINQRLTQISKLLEGMLDVSVCQEIWRFYINNPNPDRNEKIGQLHKKWEKRIVERIEDLCRKLEEVSLLQETIPLKKQVQMCIRLSPKNHRAELQEHVGQVVRSFEEKYRRGKEEVKRAINSVKEQKTPTIEAITPQLEYLMKENHEDLLIQLKKTLQSGWEKYRKQCLAKQKRLIEGSSKFYISQLAPFIDKAKPYERMLSSTCAEIKHQFTEFFQGEIRRLVSEAISKLVAKKDIQQPESDKLGKEVAELLQEIFNSIKQTSEFEPAKHIQNKLEKAYVKLAAEILPIYEKACKNTIIAKMFEGRPNPEYFSSFELIVRLEQPMGKLIEQVDESNIPLKVRGESMANYASRLKEFPKSKDLQTLFIEKMGECVAYVEKFDIADSKNDDLDERQLGEFMKRFQASVLTVAAYVQLYTFLGKERVDTSQFEKRLINAVGNIWNQSVQSIGKLDEEYDDRSLQKLNRNTLTLTSYESIFGGDNQYGKQIAKTIVDKIGKDFTKVDQLLGQYQSAVKTGDEKIKGLKTQEKKEQTKRAKTLEEESGAKQKSMTEQFEKEIKAAENEESKKQIEQSKQAALDAEAADLKIRKADMCKSVEDDFAVEINKIEKGRKEKVAGIGQSFARLKQIEIGLVVAKEVCQNSFKKLMVKVKDLGSRFCNALGQELDAIGSSYAHLILHENPKVFVRYTTNKFKAMIANAGYEFVADNIPGISEFDRNRIKDKYKAFKDHLDTFTADYSKSPDADFIKKLKTIMKSRAAELQKGYARGNPSKGHELVAEIFAMWMIKRADLSEEGVEYLYEPHPAQVIAMFLILGICGDRNERLGNRIAQIFTGEGKSIVLGGLSCYLALVGFDVSCMCYSRLLSRRDYEDFKDMFMELGIMDSVLYGTFGQVTQALFNSNKRQIRNDVQEILLNDKDCSQGFLAKVGAMMKSVPRQKALLVDEVDVFFAKEFFGQYYTPSTSITGKCIQDIATYVWHNRTSITYSALIKTAQFRACVAQYPRIQTILEYNAADMVSSVKNFKHNYIIHQGKIGYVLPQGISFQASYGWKTTFAYFFEAEKGTISVRPQDYASISIMCCSISYAELPKEFAYIMGVTGTLQILPDCQKFVLQNWYNIPNFYYIPSVYGKSRRDKFGAKVVSKQTHFAQISKAIKAQTDKNRPVVVFFPTINLVQQFYISPEFASLKENAIPLTERNDKDATYTRIVRATRAKNITVMTRAFGRGIDFVVSEKEVKEAGGLHVIQTFISQEEAEAVQIEGRTARQGSQGTYEMIINVDTLKDANITEDQLAGKSSIEAEAFIRQACRVRFENEYSLQIKAAESCLATHKTAKEMLECIKAGKNDVVLNMVQQLNKVELPFGSGATVRTVIGIDATGSMETALSQVLQNTRSCLERAYQIIRERGVESGFEVQIVIYRNYDCTAQKIFEWSPFSNNANDLINFLRAVTVEGGWGADQAVELALSHSLKFETNVDQIIIIGDAGGNSDVNMRQKRRYRGEPYWQTHPRFAEVLTNQSLISQLVERRIPVHSFYIGAHPARYFRNLSSRTGGQASQYDYTHPKAAEILTAFIVENVLQKIGGDERGRELVTAYRMRFSS